MNKKLFLIILVLFIFQSSFGWDESTHQLLTNYAINHSALNNFLFKLNFEKGLQQTLETKWDDSKIIYKSVLDWIGWGAIREDSKGIPWRNNNHFHNPIRDFINARLTDNSPTNLLNLSAVIWAQDGPEQQTFAEGDNSWKKIREYYYYGLISSEKQKRADNFSRMFKGIGHQIHLIQDCAVPDHTRNQSHTKNSVEPLMYANHAYRCIEGWAKRNAASVPIDINSIPGPQLKFAGLTENTFDPNVPRLAPVSDLIDTRKYRSFSIPSIGNDQGIAEYSSANYVSEDTIFTENSNDDIHYFPFPRALGTDFNNPFLEPLLYDENGAKVYLRKTEGESFNWFLRYSWCDWYREGADPIKLRKYVYLDDRCHFEYCKRLFPKAIGYSSAFINYFFRGQIEISLPENKEIYGFAPYPEEGFKRIVVAAKNITLDEDMTAGELFLVIRYRETHDAEFGDSVPPVPDAEDKLIITSYKENNVQLPYNELKEFSFDLATALPVSAADVSLTLVFRGTLGNEEYDAVAIGFKDISEPTAIDIYNDSDMICFNGSRLTYWNQTVLDYAETTKRDDIITPGEIDVIPRTIKLWQVSFNDLPATPTNFYFDFADAPEAKWVQIEAGQSYRMYFLTDEGKKTRFNLAYRCRRPSDTLVGYDPPWYTPGYSACNYIWDQPNTSFEIVPRKNKLVWNGGTDQFDHVKTDNFYWETKGRYFLNLIYMTQPNAPSNCTNCDLCKAYYPADGKEWRANYYINFISL